jgi:hypothetical protein
LDLAFGIASDTTKPFLDPAADIPGRASHSMFVHCILLHEFRIFFQTRVGSWTGKPCFSPAFYFRPFNEKAPSALSTVRCLLIKYRIERNLAALQVFIFVGEK